jgi:preprotein translocase subunit YajC
MLYAFTLLAQAQEAAKNESPPLIAQLAPLLIIIVLFYLLFIVPQRREKRMREEMMGKLKKNDRVITNAGIIATVTNIKDEEVTLRIDDTSNARLTVLRSSVARILTGQEQAKDTADRAPAGGTSTNIKAS